MRYPIMMMTNVTLLWLASAMVATVSLGSPLSFQQQYMVNISAVEGLIGRVLGEQYVDSFSLQQIPASANGTDVFKLSNEGSKVVLQGSSSVAIASALHWYLKYDCKRSLSWGWNGTGDNLLPLPSPLPPATPTQATSMVLFRYYMNVCTVSYSASWWTWERWEREIDWMALNGINLPLSFTGQEYVWAKVYSEMGMTEEELTAHFGGPAFLPWARMGNMQGFGGPLGPEWRDMQMALQKQIVERELSLGMTPVLPAFAGHVPGAITRIKPNANVTTSARWANFEPPYCCDTLLNPLDPLFQEIGTAFIKAQIEIYGTGHVYNGDTFNEMEPSSSDPGYLKATSAAVWQSISTADPSAIWLMQGWAFHESFWTDDALAAYLSGVPDEKLLILDLNSDASPLWSRFVANKKSFIWCMLHNYGGNRDIYGNMPVIASHPFSAKNATGEYMMGIGITPEAIEQNPVVYQMMLETTWHTEPLNVTEWVISYSERRYGSSESAKAAWELLSSTVYAGANLANSLIVRYPTLDMGPDTSQNTTALVAAWRLYLASYKELDGNVTGPWTYDLVDFTRQILSNHFSDLYGLSKAAYASCTVFGDTFTKITNMDSQTSIRRVGNCGIYYHLPACNITELEEACITTDGCAGFNSNGWLKTATNEQTPTVETDLYVRNQTFGKGCGANYADIAAPLQDVIQEFDDLLATNVNFMMGTWVNMARAKGLTNETKALNEFNARNQVTLWGPHGEINDYATKDWAGLVSRYHAARWELFFATIQSAIAQEEGPDWTSFQNEILEIAERFCDATDAFPAEPVGDAYEMAQRFQTKYTTVTNFHSTPNVAPTATPYFTAWTKDIGQLGALCNVDSTCQCYDELGQMYRKCITTAGSSTLYVKQEI